MLLLVVVVVIGAVCVLDGLRTKTLVQQKHENRKEEAKDHSNYL